MQVFACILRPRYKGAFMEQLVKKPNLGAVVFAIIFIASLFMLLADQAATR